MFYYVTLQMVRQEQQRENLYACAVRTKAWHARVQLRQSMRRDHRKYGVSADAGSDASWEGIRVRALHSVLFE